MASIFRNNFTAYTLLGTPYIERQEGMPTPCQLRTTGRPRYKMKPYGLVLLLNQRMFAETGHDCLTRQPAFNLSCASLLTWVQRTGT